MTVVVPPQGLRRQEDISPAEREELVMAYIKAPYGTKKAAAAAARVNLVWIRNWRAAPSDAELYCERHYLAVILDLFEVRLPSYRLPLGDLIADFGALSSKQFHVAAAGLLLFLGQQLAPRQIEQLNPPARVAVPLHLEVVTLKDVHEEPPQRGVHARPLVLPLGAVCAQLLGVDLTSNRRARGPCVKDQIKVCRFVRQSLRILHVEAARTPFAVRILPVRRINRSTFLPEQFVTVADIEAEAHSRHEALLFHLIKRNLHPVIISGMLPLRLLGLTFFPHLLGGRVRIIIGVPVSKFVVVHGFVDLVQGHETGKNPMVELLAQRI